MLRELLNITGFSFTGIRFQHKEAEAALYVIAKLFPKNKKFIGGSVAIHGEGRDIDIFIRGGEEDIARAKELGFVPANEDYPIADFCSLRYFGINLIFLTTHKEYQRVAMALKVCCDLSDLVDVDKDLRVRIHESIRKFGIREEKVIKVKRELPRLNNVPDVPRIELRIGDAEILGNPDRAVIPHVPLPHLRWDPVNVVMDELDNE